MYVDGTPTTSSKIQKQENLLVNNELKRSSPKILYVQYSNPAAYPPLEHSSRILAEQGWQVFFLGIRGFGGADLLGFPFHSNIVVRKLPFCPGGWKQKFHYLWFCIWVMGWTLFWRPRWIYASDLLSCPLALLLSFFPFLKVIYHEHDSPFGSDGSFWRRFCLWTRKKLAHRAKQCVLPDRNRAFYFSGQTGIKNEKVAVVWNCPAKEEVREEKRIVHEERLRIYYHGSLGSDRLSLSVLRAMAMFPDSIELSVVWYETMDAEAYLQEFKSTAAQLGVEHRIHIRNALSRRYQLMAHAQHYDVGLAMVSRNTDNINLRHSACTSNKVFDYLACGMAVLVSDLPDWRKIYVASGYGLACNPEDPKSIVDALQWFLDHPREMREMGERGRQRISAEWNYEQQFKPVLEMICKYERVNL